MLGTCRNRGAFYDSAEFFTTISSVPKIYYVEAKVVQEEKVRHKLLYSDFILPTTYRT